MIQALQKQIKIQNARMIQMNEAIFDRLEAAENQACVCVRARARVCVCVFLCACQYSCRGQANGESIILYHKVTALKIDTTWSLT